MFDLIIKNGSIYDGKGSKPYQAHIAISNEKIVEIGDIKVKLKRSSMLKGKLLLLASLIFILTMTVR